ncbi:dihydrofolate reductase [Patescibacteria group bacterium]|nr:dihydrofolate reductase [Patescibacteria group bacterium]
MHVFLIAAISIDGQIAEATDQVSTAWTSKEDHKFFVQRTKQAGAMVFGSSTFRTFNRILPGRANIVYTRDVEQFRASTPLTVVEVTGDTTELQNTEVLYATSLEPKTLVAVLEKAGVNELAVCGGSSIYAQFVKAGVVQTLYLTLEPIAIGKGVPLFAESVQTRLTLNNVTHLSEQTLLLEYSTFFVTRENT